MARPVRPSTWFGKPARYMLLECDGIGPVVNLYAADELPSLVRLLCAWMGTGGPMTLSVWQWLGGTWQPYAVWTHS